MERTVTSNTKIHLPGLVYNVVNGIVAGMELSLVGGWFTDEMPSVDPPLNALHCCGLE